ncbi:sensor histidine kinase [Taibaiella chishuiensis]|uniref:histidine kinase n=1 Tax=Taibaiella chishuiensis TaxID=1434707 RepID=A0A2P8DCB7_9BACT|nr:ATP-binding protein [Taibaiella chishuiensis]PSK94860.1 phospho-acceptor domain-containing protein [Taibaiella chishuiensis]
MRIISFLYFFLLTYIIAALVFWGISLNKQNEVIFSNEIETLQVKVDSVARPEAYRKAYAMIKERENSRKRQYLGEGATFLAIIMIGAGVVYSSIRSSHLLSRQQTNFILSVTHELKSPIAAMKLNLQTMARRKLNEETQQQLITRSVNEANRLDDLCNNLLLASQIESRHFKPADERFDLSEVVEECVTAYIHRDKQQFMIKLEDECFTSGDRFLWKLAINNLLENAAKYAPQDTLVTVELQRQDDELVLSIADEGEGIPDEEKAKIFRKFYRIGNENSRKTKGTGLGLYLTSKIIQQFKGAILVRNNTPKGSVFEITAPAA